MVAITPVYPQFVAEITGVDLQTGVSETEFADIQTALDTFAVLVIPDQVLSEEKQLAFASLFGPLETSVGASIYNANAPRRVATPQLSDISNLDDKGEILEKNDIRRLINLSNRLWHTDSSFKKTPASVSILSAQEVAPVGGATEFADMRAAWKALPDERKEALKDKLATHDYFHSRMLAGLEFGVIPDHWRDKQPPVQQPLVRKHHKNERLSLYLASHISHIGDLSSADSLNLLDELIQFSTQAQFVYRHRWRANDVVIWDNRYTMHRGQAFNEVYRRSMRRATVQDTSQIMSH